MTWRLVLMLAADAVAVARLAAAAVTRPALRRPARLAVLAFTVLAVMAAGLIAIAAPLPVLRNRPAQPAAIVYAVPGHTGQAAAYAHSGALVIASQANIGDPVFRRISRAGGTVLVYLNTLAYGGNDGRWAAMLYQRSGCGPAVPRWGRYTTGTGLALMNFPGRAEQRKLGCVLENMVRANPQMGGFFADDLGSRSWYPGVDWARFPARAAWRAGAVALAKTFRAVASEHGLIVMVNGTWAAGSLAADGGGYPDMGRSGLSLADGGMAEHHDGQLGYFGPYACSRQWAQASPVTHGVAFNIAVTATLAGARQFARSCYAFTDVQTDYGRVPPPRGRFHPTGLPSHVSR